MKILSAIIGAIVLMAAAPAAQAGRGDAGQLNIIYWQAPSILNPFLSAGIKDVDAAALVIEPLARYDENGNLVPWLAEEIPTVANGGVSEDLTTITWKLKDGLKWSDGTDVTSADVVFSAEYCLDPDGGCQQLSRFADVEMVEALDRLTVRVTFSRPKPFPYGPFVGADSPIIQKAQFEACKGARAPECTEQNFNPVGTGPYMVKEFRANDSIIFEVNPYYRDPDKPAFSTVLFKGGGDAAAAARSVLETGEFDYAWNLQIDPAILRQMEATGKGVILSAFASSVESLMLNLTNPDPALGELRSTLAGGPHPFLSDPAVRKAMSMAIDRALLAEVGYGDAGAPSCNILAAPPVYASTANESCLQQDLAGANALLDEAGWMPGPDGIRQKNGVRLSVLYQTSTNAVRQDTQALIKQWWREIGIETELKNVSAAVFFGGDQSSPDTFQKFYADVEMYTNLFNGTDLEAFLGYWHSGNIPSPDNNWLGLNIPRYVNAAYDALLAELASTADIEARGEIARRMNDMLVQDYVMIPLVNRGTVSARVKSLTGVRLNTWDSEMWNVADWDRE